MTINLELAGCTVSGIGVGHRGEVTDVYLRSQSGTKYALHSSLYGTIKVEKEKQ